MELPESNGKDAIMVIVDSVTKQSHFVSTVTTLSTVGTAQLYLQHIWKHHGLPKRVVSDRDPQFVVEFTRELYRLLRVKLAATTMYHPSGDRQTERINQELDNSSAFLSIRGKMIGMTSSPSQNSSIIIISIPQLRTSPSS